MKKKTIPTFYIIYFAVVFFVLIALFVSLHFLNNFLANFEMSQPKYTAEKIVEDYFKAEDKNVLLAKSSYSIPKYSSVIEVVTYLDEIIDEDNINYYSVSSNDESLISYAVSSNDLKIGTFTLKADERAEGQDIDTFSLVSLDLSIGGSEAVKIKAPEGYTVLVNNVPLTSEFLTGEVEEDESCKHMYEGVTGVSYVTYKVGELFSAPKITAKDKNGNEVLNITSNEDNIIYKVPMSYIDVPEEHKDNILTAAELYAAYMQNDAGFARVAKYVDRTAPLYTNLRTSQTMWVIDHNGYSIEEPELSEFYYYDDNTFSCRVKFVHVLHRRGMTDYENAFDMTFYYRNVNGSFLIYDSQVN